MHESELAAMMGRALLQASTALLQASTAAHNSATVGLTTGCCFISLPNASPPINLFDHHCSIIEGLLHAPPNRATSAATHAHLHGVETLQLRRDGGQRHVIVDAIRRLGALLDVFATGIADKESSKAGRVDDWCTVV